MLDDGMNTASPFAAREAQREFKRRPHQRHGENSDQSGCAGEAGSSEGQTTAKAAQDVFSADADLLEAELRQEVRTVPHRVDCTLEDKARCGALYNHDRNTPFGRGVRIGSAEHR